MSRKSDELSDEFGRLFASRKIECMIRIEELKMIIFIFSLKRQGVLLQPLLPSLEAGKHLAPSKEAEMKRKMLLIRKAHLIN